MRGRGLHMKNKKICIITTTINPPKFLLEYFLNFQKFNVPLHNVTFIVVADNKTPDIQLYKRYSDFIEYWSPRKQDKWLTKTFPNKTQKIKEYLIPINDMRRRNFGYLRAIELQADITITIDDDNLPQKNVSWLHGHIKSFEVSHQIIYSSNQLVNPCNSLLLNHKNIYSRGYPIAEHYSNIETLGIKTKKSILNMGLWTNKPDVDSFTNCLYPDLKSEGLKNEGYSLAEYNYFPVNTQNTVFTKKLNIFHNLFMDSQMFHRFDDIWMGLFTQRLMHKMGDTASFGKPIVEHRRNTHDYIKDFFIEYQGLTLNSKVWKSIMELPIKSKNYKDGFLEIADMLPNIFRDSKIKKYFVKMRTSMYLWVELIEKL